ncbi:hypothetical protein MMC11_005522 [Xylographa trunciseda]|nr:hypothetical protein [Xylographa trunciseda]
MPGIVETTAVEKAISEGWWLDASNSISPSSRKLLESYSGIAPDKVVPHVEEIRLEGLKMSPNPYFGNLRFLDITINDHPRYREILERLFREEVLLDFDCGLGQNVRQLVYDGVPMKNIYGWNFDHRHSDLGYGLFKDHRTQRAKFLAGKLLDKLKELSALKGGCKLIHVAGFFESYSMFFQLLIGRYLVERLQPQKGCWIFGQQEANLHSGEYLSPHGGPMVFRHNIESWTAFWTDVGLQTGTRWRVEAVLEEPVPEARVQELSALDRRRMVFTVIME